MKRNIKDALYDWGQWAREGMGKGYRSISPGFNVKSDGVFRVITDEEAMRIDRGVAELRDIDAISYEQIKLRYIERYSVKDIADKINIPRSTVYNDLKTAEWYLAGRMGYRVNDCSINNLDCPDKR